LQVGDINIDIKNNGVTDPWEIAGLIPCYRIRTAHTKAAVLISYLSV